MQRIPGALTQFYGGLSQADSVLRIPIVWRIILRQAIKGRDRRSHLDMANSAELVSLKGREKHKVSLPRPLHEVMRAVCDERGLSFSDGMAEAAIITLILLGRLPAGTYKELEKSLYGVAEGSIDPDWIAPVRSAIRSGTQLRKEREGYSKKPIRRQSDGFQEGGSEGA